MFFVYQVTHPTTHIVISDHPWKQMRQRGITCEILRQFKTIQDARHWVFVTYPEQQIVDEVSRAYSGVSPESRERMRQAKLGDKNPNAQGLSDEHKQKIAETMKSRRGEFHHMWNRKHREESKRKIARSMRRLPKRRWCLDEQGIEHFVPADMELPPGWTWGRKRGTTGLRYF